MHQTLRRQALLTDTAIPPVKRLQAALAAFPQLTEIPTEHVFADRMYCRVVRHPAGVLIVGKEQTRPHLFAVVSGVVAVTQGDGAAVELGPGTVIACSGGEQRAAFALTDAVVLTVHQNPTDTRDVDALAREIFKQGDPFDFFDANNRLRPERLAAQEALCLESP